MSVDPYFLSAYAEASALLERGRAETFYYSGPEGELTHSFILRDIPTSNGGAELCDLVSPYGYGGPLLRPASVEDLPALSAAFEREFGKYCFERGVVSEFVRFHPFEDSAKHLQKVYEVQRLRQTVVTDLAGDNIFEREFSKSVRKKFRRNERLGMTTTCHVAPSNLEDFRRLYAMTLERNNAAQFYYFDKSYFDALLYKLSDSILLADTTYEGKVIAAALCLTGAGRIHIHLSGTHTDFLSISPAYNLRVGIAQWGIDNGMQLIHHGGGRTNDPDDSLLAYKKQFGSKMTMFAIGTRVWDQSAYNALSALSVEQAGYFPAYRSRS